MAYDQAYADALREIDQLNSVCQRLAEAEMYARMDRDGFKAQARDLAAAISVALAHGDRTHLGTVRGVLVEAVNEYRRTQLISPTSPSKDGPQETTE